MKSRDGKSQRRDEKKKEDHKSATPKRGLDLQWSGLAMVFFIQKYENM